MSRYNSVFLFLAGLLLACQPAIAGSQNVVVEFGDLAHDMAIDRARNRIYVSIPARNEIAIVSSQSFQIVNRVFVGSRPHGIDISHDGSLLFVALNQAGAVAYLDLDTLAVSEVVVGNELDSARAFDVVEGRPNRVFVSANPGSGGFARIVMIKRDENNTPVTVASNQIIRCNPNFVRSPDLRSLYLGACFSPNSLYKLDITDDAAPIILEDNHGSVSGTNHLEVSSDGLRIYLTSGQVLRTGSFIQTGSVGSGIPELTLDGSQVYVSQTPNRIRIYSTATQTQVDELTLPCTFSSIKQTEFLRQDQGFLVLGDDLLCGMGVDTGPATTVKISPPCGTYLTSQIFDFAMVLEPGGLSVSAATITVDGVDLTSALQPCLVPGNLTSGGLSFRCSQRRRVSAGTYEVTAVFNLSDGSTVSDNVTWRVLEVVE